MFHPFILLLDLKCVNSNKKYQFIIGMYYGDKWDSSNDWSRKGIKELEGDYDNIVGGVELAEKCENVCVYADGKLVGGTEPDGTQPAKVYKIAQLVRLHKMLHGTSPFTDKDSAMQFDFNSDSKVDIYDEIILRKLILKSML